MREVHRCSQRDDVIVMKGKVVMSFMLAIPPLNNG